MIKYSIRRQMTAIFIGLFSLILGLVLIINNAFLGHYYLSHKADDLIRTYNDVNAKLESGSLSDSDSVRDILTQLERANVDLVVVDSVAALTPKAEMRSLRHLEKAIRV